MAQHAILRFEKHKGSPARPLEAHHERQKDEYASNPDIDTSRSKYNFHIVKPEGRYYHFIQSRIEQAGCRTRKDSTRFVDTLITASPEFFKGKSPKEIWQRAHTGKWEVADCQKGQSLSRMGTEKCPNRGGSLRWSHQHPLQRPRVPVRCLLVFPAGQNSIILASANGGQSQGCPPLFRGQKPAIRGHSRTQGAFGVYLHCKPACQKKLFDKLVDGGVNSPAVHAAGDD